MSRSFMCAGNIAPSRFVKADSSKTGGFVLQAGAGEAVVGISQTGVRQPPISGLDDGYAGINNTNAIEVLTETDEGWLELGGTVSFGDLLKADASGKGVASSSDGENYGALSLESGTSGKLIRVRVRIGSRGN